jgi:hypothetical protein
MLSQNEMRCVQAPLYTKAKLTPLTCFFNINTDACRSNTRIEGTVTPKRREDELDNLKLYLYSLRLKVSVVFTSRETTLTKYILKNINIYGT